MKMRSVALACTPVFFYFIIVSVQVCFVVVFLWF